MFKLSLHKAFYCSTKNGMKCQQLVKLINFIGNKIDINKSSQKSPIAKLAKDLNTAPAVQQLDRNTGNYHKNLEIHEERPNPYDSCGLKNCRKEESYEEALAFTGFKSKGTSAFVTRGQHSIWSATLLTFEEWWSNLQPWEGNCVSGRSSRKTPSVCPCREFGANCEREASDAEHSWWQQLKSLDSKPE